MATAFKQVVHQNLECSVCLDFFKEPKILTCSHTFCKGCLKTLLETQQDEEKLPCPVCRKETSVPDGDVSRLQTNIALRSLVADVETQGPVCANCGPEDKTLVVVYCKDCSKYLCESCKSMHCNWVEFSDHSLVAASDVLSGKIPLKRRCKCQKHPKEDEECFCIGCSKYVCFRCAMLEHAHEGHKVSEADAHEAEQKKNIDQLTCQAKAKISDLDKYVTIVDEQRERLQKIKTKLFNDIDEAHGEASRRLDKGREELRREVGRRMEERETDLADLKEKGHQQIVQVNAVCGLVKNGLKVPLQEEALTAHNKLCQDLEELLDRVEHDEEQPRRTVDDVEQLHFVKSRGSKGFELGQLRRGESKWILHAEIELPTPNSMMAMTISPKNTVAIGCQTGGILTYSADGVFQGTVLKTVKVRGFHFMSDYSYVTRGMQDTVSLYTPRFEKRDVVFETQSDKKGAHGGFTVDQDGNILLSYWKAKVIQVFKPEGGRVIREILCDGFGPGQICAMPSRKMILVWDGLSTVRVIDGVSGTIINSITKDGVSAHPSTCSLCRDDSVIIAWVKTGKGLVSINHYTRELKHTRNLITGFRITKPARNWYYLQQFKTGEIAFCTSDRLYIFRETWEE